MPSFFILCDFMKIYIYIHIVLCLSILVPFSVSAKWYPSGTSVDTTLEISNCSPDWDTDSIWPTLWDATGPAGDTWFQYTNGQTQVTGGAQCDWWDATPPTVSNLGYANSATNGWTNNTTMTLNWSAIDTGWSGLKEYDIRMYRVFGAQNNPSPMDYVGSFTTFSNATTYVITGVTGYAYAFAICARDIAGNDSCATPVWSPDVARLDTSTPNVAVVTDVSVESVLADSSQNFNFSFNDTTAPIKVWYRVEDNNNPGIYNSHVTPDPFGYTYTYTESITTVDNDRWANGGRELTILIDQVCDEAGNCVGTVGWPPIKTITHTIYANPNSVPPASNTQNSTILTDGSAVADGQLRNFIQIIKDGYWNAIVPATGINRTIAMNLSDISNTMYINQYTRNPALGTSVYLTVPGNGWDIPLDLGVSQLFTNLMVSNDGTYPVWLQVYTPTANSYWPLDPVSDPLAIFGFTTNLVVNDTIIGLAANKTFSQILSDPIFRPLYAVQIVGDIRNGGFIEWTEQVSSWVVTNNNLAVTPSAVELQLEFSGSNVWSFDLYGWSMSSSPTPIALRGVMVTNPGNSSTDIFTKLVQKSNIVVSSGSYLQLSTHYSYSLNGKSVLYNSDIIWRMSFFDPLVINLGNQVWVKVIGPIASNTIRSIVDWQFSEGTSIFSWLSRSVVRNSSRQLVEIAIRNMKYNPAGDTITSTVSLPIGGTTKGSLLEKWSDNSIMSIDKNGWNVTLSLSSWILGKRTLVVKWANVYINTNMYYANPNSILGIVIQKDKNGNGWNLYIDPSVNNIVGTYFIDGSILSYNGTSEIGIGNIGILKNQLHIFGSIVSENTLGGSRMNPIQCPSLLNLPCTSAGEAQKYDLNYLRRYYIYNSQPFGWAKVIGGATCTAMVCTWFDANLIKKFTSPSEELAKYPVIIEYNPLIRTDPPIGFEWSKD